MKTNPLVFLLLILLAVSCSNELNDISISEFTLVGALPDQINECSGFTRIEEDLIVISDSGEGPILKFVNIDNLSPTSDHVLSGIQNIDWETIISDQESFWIGDFGNNFGSRMDLKIYSVSKSLQQIDSINFNYPDQIVFDTIEHDYDCEAMIKIDNDLFLFTKNRSNQLSNIYKLNILTKEIALIQSIEVPAGVTDAYYNSEGKTIILLCNNKIDDAYENYLQVMSINNDGLFNITDTFPIPIDEQFEALTKKEENTYIIGSEKESVIGGNVYVVDIEGL